MYGFLRRLRVYPIVIKDLNYMCNNQSNPSTRVNSFYVLDQQYLKLNKHEFDRIIRLCDGSTSVELLSFLIQRGYQETRFLLDSVLTKDPRVQKVMYMRR